MQSNEEQDNESYLPRTPARDIIRPRYRRTSDVIDSIGKSSPSSTLTSYSAASTSRPFDSPFHQHQYYSPTASCTSYSVDASSTPDRNELYFLDAPATADNGNDQAVVHGFVTPQRSTRLASRWKPVVGSDSSLFSPDCGYSTPERENSNIGFCTPDYNSRTESRDALGFKTRFYQFSSEVCAKSPVKKDADCYYMNHTHRGKCVIFNHEKFDNAYEKRIGSNVDARRIAETFQRLGFNIEIYNDLEFVMVMKKIDELSQEDHSNNDCFCIFVLTHGMKNNVICAKDAAYKTDKLWKPFTADKCITLAGKPKLFFIQACRGDSLDEGVLMHLSSQTDSNESIDSYKIPTHADFLVANSTADGFYSWRSPTEGTWYIQSLCQTLDEYAHTTDLGRILTITTRKVALDYASQNPNPTMHNLKQVPMITSTLIRDVYFLPKNR